MRLTTGSQQMTCCTVVTLLTVKSESLAHGGKAVLSLLWERMCMFQIHLQFVKWTQIYNGSGLTLFFTISGVSFLLFVQFCFTFSLVIRKTCVRIISCVCLCVYYSTRSGVFSFISSPVSSTLSNHFPFFLCVYGFSLCQVISCRGSECVLCAMSSCIHLFQVYSESQSFECSDSQVKLFYSYHWLTFLR